MSSRRQRTVLLKELITSERSLLADPRYAERARSLIAEAEREVAPALRLRLHTTSELELAQVPTNA